MTKKYKALRLVGTVYKIIGVIILVVTIIGAAGSCISGLLGSALLSGLADQFSINTSPAGSGGMVVVGIVTGFAVLLWGLIVGVTTYALGEGVYLLIDIEENTRLSATLLQKDQKELATPD
jgi:hypothetical protein